MAPALQIGLEKFAKPWYKLRNLNIFRDEASLAASPHLWSNIVKALDDSEFLVYMASPESAKSKWVTKEIEYWLEHKSIDKLLIVLTEGEIIWDENENHFLTHTNNALSQALMDAFDSEPFYIDLRDCREDDNLSLNNSIFKKEIFKASCTYTWQSSK